MTPSAVRRSIAEELASTVACSDLRVAARESSVVWRALASSMTAAGGGGGGTGVGWGCSGGEDDRHGEECLDRDTRLSRASKDRVGGPRLRSS